jgi:hypothetical protein
VGNVVAVLEMFVSALLKYAWISIKSVTVDYVRGVSFSAVARAMSLLLAFSALALGVIFISVLSPDPGGGRLPLGEGLTFVGLLLTAASFFANAGRPN